jgi:hypothetical protein
VQICGADLWCKCGANELCIFFGETVPGGTLNSASEVIENPPNNAACGGIIVLFYLVTLLALLVGWGDKCVGLRVYIDRDQLTLKHSTNIPYLSPDSCEVLCEEG